MDEEEDLHRYGTPLEPLEKDEVPAKKPVAIEDQIVKDENGKRRFHGAFTGGFSAGFWNTVGSLEGWTPQSFKSSRKDKAEQRAQQRPEDFMDQEDLGEFGIAPQGIRTRDEFSKGENSGTVSRKRKLMQPEVGAIPGAPVLEQLLTPVRDKVAVRILKSMGWKPGQGVGPRQTRKEKRQAKARNQREKYLLEHYGCGEDDGLRAKAIHDGVVDVAGHSSSEEENDVDDDDDEELTFAPDDYEPLLQAVKDNRFGLSYSGLSRAPVLSLGKSGNGAAAPAKHFNLFGPLEVIDKNKKLSISGQAFGVGALEEDDEDIYARDDMTKYDFALGGAGKPKQKRIQHVQAHGVIAGFVEDKSGTTYNEPYTIDLPRDFEPRNWAVRRSRFAPLEPERARKLVSENQHKKAGLGRHDLDAEQRAQLLGEETPVPKTVESGPKNPFKSKVDKTKDLLARINATSCNFTRGGIINSEGEEQQKTSESVDIAPQVQQTHSQLLVKAAAKTKHLDTSTGSFKPFLGNCEKQARYEQFLASKLQDDAEISKFLNEIQPVTLSAWDREMEKKEFIQARNIYKPLGGIMSDRFVSESIVEQEQIKKEVQPATTVKKIVMERNKCTWKPSALLCKRYNIAEPYGVALLADEKPQAKKPKMSVFDYLETSINTKANFQTPVIIPKHIERAEPAAIHNLSAIKPTTIALETLPSAKSAEEPSVITSPLPVSVVKSHVPKSELEQRVAESKDIPIAEKTELFKSIFDDSDDEAETEPTISQDEHLSADAAAARIEQLKAQLGLPTMVKNAAAANVLRNNSPPRGIFAALFRQPEKDVPQQEAPKEEEQTQVKTEVAAPTKIAFKPRSERLKKETDEQLVDVYGPKMPTNTAARTNTSDVECSLDAKLLKLWQKQQTAESSKSKHKKGLIIEEQWVEKCADSQDSDSDSLEQESSNSNDDDDARSSQHRHKIKKSKKDKSKKSSSSSSKKHKKKTKKKTKKHDKSHKSKKKKSKKNK